MEHKVDYLPDGLEWDPDLPLAIIIPPYYPRMLQQFLCRRSQSGGSRCKQARMNPLQVLLHHLDGLRKLTGRILILLNQDIPTPINFEVILCSFVCSHSIRVNALYLYIIPGQKKKEETRFTQEEDTIIVIHVRKKKRKENGDDK